MKITITNAKGMSDLEVIKLCPNEGEATVYIKRNEQTRNYERHAGTEIEQRESGVSLRRHGQGSQGLRHRDSPSSRHASG